MNRLSKREQVMVGVALLVAILASGYFYVLEPRWAEIKNLEQDLIPAREAVLVKARARIAQRDTVQGELAQIGAAVEKLSQRLLPGATPPLAASALQRQIKDVAAAAGVEVRSERILQPVERGGLLEVPVEITVAGGIREITSLLYRLDETTMLLTLQDLKVRVISIGQPRDLLTTLTVSGFILSSAPPQNVEKPSGPPKG